MPPIHQRLTYRHWATLIVASAALAALGIWFFSRPEPPPSPELGTPKLSLSSIDPARRTRPLYFDRAALPWLKQNWAQWEKAFGNSTATPEELVAEFDLGLQSPHVWRSIDRKWRFGAVLLTGDPVAYRPLLDALRTAPDWVLTRIDPTSYLFERVENRQPARAWNTALDLPSLLATFNQHSQREQIMARVQLAHRLLFLEDLQNARALINDAFRLDPKSKEAWTELASLYGMSNQWPDAARAAERALARDSGFRPARLILANANFGMARYEDALAITRELYATGPIDGELLLIHAKVTHSAHAYQEEAEVLQRLIALMQGRAQPVGFWQIYLGQALSASGESMLAAEQFRNALKDENLRPTDREYVEKALERLDSRQEIPLNLPGGMPKAP